MKIASFKIPLIDSRLADIVPVSLFNSLFEISLIIGTVGELLLSVAGGDIVLPLPAVLVMLERVEVDSLTVSLVIINISFIRAAVVKDVPPLPLSCSVAKVALVVGSVLKKDLTFSVELVAGPLPVVIALWLGNLLVCLADGALGH